MSENQPQSKTPRRKQQKDNFVLQYSPRTDFNKKIEDDEEIYKELKKNFDPISIKIVKKHFKERLGELTKEVFVAILKNHLLGFLPNHPEREEIMVKLLNRLFSEIDLNDNGSLEWNELTTFIIHNTGSQESKDNNLEYRLKFYSPSPYGINPEDLTDMITYAFFIDKFNLIGVVEEGRSTIVFFDVKSCNKQKISIDIKDVQPLIDQVQFSALCKRAEEKERREQNKYKMFDQTVRDNKFPKKAKFNEEDEDYIFGSDDPEDIVRKQEREKELEMEKMQKEKKKNLNIFNEKPKFHVNKKLSIICCCFIPDYDIILISGTNNTITAWKLKHGEIKNVNALTGFNLTEHDLKVAIFIGDSPQYSMVWDPQTKFVYTGQKDGKILKWSLTRATPIKEDTLDIEPIRQKMSNNKATNPMKGLKPNSDIKRLQQLLQLRSVRFKGKSENFLVNDRDKNLTVSCLLIIEKLQLLAASYFNGYLILWDCLLKEHRKCYCDQTTGIYAMTFDENKNLIFTCGFSHDIYVYDPYIAGSAIYVLTGHAWSINSIDVNEKESEMLSLDIFGNIKIWDSQSLETFQTIKLREEFEDNVKKGNKDANIKNSKLSSNLKMLYIKKLKKIFIYGNKLLAFETDRNNCPNLADDQLICACYYDKIQKTILSFCLRKIKIWRLLTGKVKQIYEDPMGNEITAVAVDRNVKRGFIGDNSGKIKNINLKNGTLIKDITPHNCEIKFICHSMALNLVASCSTDNVIKIHDDEELLETEVIKELTISPQDVKAICICDRFSRLAIGLSNGVVKFYDIDHVHYDSDLITDPTKIEDEVSALAALDDIELVFVGYASGKGKFIVCPPSPEKFVELYTFTNYKKDQDLTKDKRGISITAIEFDKVNHYMFIGDYIGNVSCYNIGPIYDYMEVYQNEHPARNFDNEPIISKENIDKFRELVIEKVWIIEAHNQIIKHIHYIDLEPRLIITTSRDLRLKIWDANDGSFQDEFKQISNRTKPVPISIKYFHVNPFSSDAEDDKEEEEYTVIKREDIAKFQPDVYDDTETKHIIDYAKKITDYKAKEKLFLSTRTSTVPKGQSNNWNLNVDIQGVFNKEHEEYLKLFETVKDIEKITLESERKFKEISFYSVGYKPEFIEKIDDKEELMGYSKLINDRLKFIKLAIFKANSNITKFSDVKKLEKMTKSQSANNLLAPATKRIPTIKEEDKKEDKEEEEKKIEVKVDVKLNSPKKERKIILPPMTEKKKTKVTETNNDKSKTRKPSLGSSSISLSEQIRLNSDKDMSRLNESKRLNASSSCKDLSLSELSQMNVLGFQRRLAYEKFIKNNPLPKLFIPTLKNRPLNSFKATKNTSLAGRFNKLEYDYLFGMGALCKDFYDILLNSRTKKSAPEKDEFGYVDTEKEEMFKDKHRRFNSMEKRVKGLQEYFNENHKVC